MFSAKSIISLLVVLVLTGVAYAVFTTQPLLIGQADKERTVSSDSSLQDSETQKEIPVDIPKFDKDNPLAKGVILKFHQWPDEKETTLIFEQLKKVKLEKPKKN